ncbi:MAG: hypothetical protein HC888_01075 [Candidatus Competibacteraceae bacterium]|nr:hypothetical protein [Candidatus Competibacteraceae bacterium]
MKVMYAKVKGSTPKGEALFPSLVTPNEYGSLSIYVIVDEDSPKFQKVKALHAQCSKDFNQLEQWKKEANRKKIDPQRPWTPALDADGNAIPGLVKIKASCKPETASGKKRVIRVVDATTGAALENPDIGNGSIVQVGFTPKVYFAPQGGFGVSFSLDMVIVHAAVYGNTGKMSDYGFDDDEDSEGGYGFGNDDEPDTDGGNNDDPPF